MENDGKNENRETKKKKCSGEEQEDVDRGKVIDMDRRGRQMEEDRGEVRGRGKRKKRERRREKGKRQKKRWKRKGKWIVR